MRLRPLFTLPVLLIFLASLSTLEPKLAPRQAEVRAVSKNPATRAPAASSPALAACGEAFAPSASTRWSEILPELRQEKYPLYYRWRKLMGELGPPVIARFGRFDGVKARFVPGSESGGISNQGLYFYQAPNGSPRVAKLLRGSLEKFDELVFLQLFGELQGTLVGHRNGGPRLHRIGQVKRLFKVPLLFVELDWVFADDPSAFPLKFGGLKNYEQFEFQDAEGLTLTDRIARMTVELYRKRVAPLDPDMLISPAKPRVPGSVHRLRWIDTQGWKEFGTPEKHREEFVRAFVMLMHHTQRYEELLRSFLHLLARDQTLMPQEKEALAVELSGSLGTFQFTDPSFPSVRNLQRLLTQKEPPGDHQGAPR